MQITGSLTDCAYPELLQFLERTQATGRFSLKRSKPSSRPGVQGSSSVDEIWLEKGYLVGITQPSRSNSLFWLIHQQGWQSYNTLTQLAKCIPVGTAAGTYLRTQGVLKAAQVQQLFNLQIMEGMRRLSTPIGSPSNRGSDQAVSVDHYEFNSEVTLPWEVLTGLRMPVSEALRLLRPGSGGAATGVGVGAIAGPTVTR